MCADDSKCMFMNFYPSDSDRLLPAVVCLFVHICMS